MQEIHGTSLLSESDGNEHNPLNVHHSTVVHLTLKLHLYPEWHQVNQEEDTIVRFNLLTTCMLITFKVCICNFICYFTFLVHKYKIMETSLVDHFGCNDAFLKDLVDILWIGAFCLERSGWIRNFSGTHSKISICFPPNLRLYLQIY